MTIKNHLLISLITSLLLTGCVSQTTTQQPEAGNPKPMGQLVLKSTGFMHQSPIPSQYTCDGENINPALEIISAPAEAKSLALIVDDPDAPAGVWVHWLLWNIAPDTTKIAENTAPQGAVQGKTDFGDNKYGGPCPPSGTHRYQFKLYALDTLLDLSQTARKKDLEKAMKGHILDETMLVGLYSRK
jgi:Raf kinase inhibitor-like YbhB/YbcL family protein